MKFPEQFRVTRPGIDFYNSEPGDDFGMFVIPRIPGTPSQPFIRELKVIASAGQIGIVDVPWEHVSVSVSKNQSTCPTWEEMCYVKDLFWGEEDCVLQYHPSRSNYVNVHPGCLHLWRPLKEKIPVPPSFAV